MDIKIIGQGCNGFVVLPAVNGIDNMVSKISSESTLEEELQNINLLPEGGPYKIDKNSQIKPLPNDLKELLPNIEDSYYMNIPYIDGKALEEYFSEDGIFLGSLAEIHHQLKLLLNLREEIAQLNGEYNVKHGDIQNVNIMYSTIDDRMYLIDFGLTRTINREDEEEEDEEGQDDDLMNFDDNIINVYLKSLLLTKIGHNWIVNHSICEFSKYINDFNVFKYSGDFIEGVKYDKVDFLKFHPDREAIMEKVNNMLANKPTYKRDEEIHELLYFPYSKPSYEITEVNIENLKEALHM